MLLLEGVETKAQKCQRGTQNDFGGQRLSRSGDIIAGWERTSGIKESMGRSWCQVGNIAQRCFENHGAECVAAKISGFFCRAGQKKKEKKKEHRGNREKHPRHEY